MSSKNINTSSKRLKKKLAHASAWKTVSKYKGAVLYELEKNGLQLLHVPIRGRGTVTTNIVYHVGSRHENRGVTGATHMLEHMMFKPVRGSDGKRHLSWRGLATKGAHLNATTWLDRTHYYFNLPVEHLKEMITVEAERMRGLVLEDAELLPERANVLSEYHMVMDRPQSALDNAVINAAFTSHGYGHETIGHKPDIESYTCEKLQHFYNHYYWPNNATLVVVGDIAKEPLLSMVREVFGPIPRSVHEIDNGSITEPEQIGVRRVEVVKKSPVNILSMQYKGVPGTHPDWVVLHVLMTYLADGRTSLLYKRLVDTRKATAVSSDLLRTHDPCLFGVTVTLGNGVLHEEVEYITQRALKEVTQRPVEEALLERVKRKCIAEELYARDGTFAIADDLTEYVAMGDWKKYFTLADEIQHVSTKDVMRVAKEYLLKSNLTVGYFKGTS